MKSYDHLLPEDPYDRAMSAIAGGSVARRRENANRAVAANKVARTLGIEPSDALAMLNDAEPKNIEDEHERFLAAMLAAPPSYTPPFAPPPPPSGYRPVIIEDEPPSRWQSVKDAVRAWDATPDVVENSTKELKRRYDDTSLIMRVFASSAFISFALIGMLLLMQFFDIFKTEGLIPLLLLVASGLSFACITSINNRYLIKRLASEYNTSVQKAALDGVKKELARLRDGSIGSAMGEVSMSAIFTTINRKREAVSEYKSGMITLNQARSLAGYPDYGYGGDMTYDKDRLSQHREHPPTAVLEDCYGCQQAIKEVLA